jgi:ATP-dependent RNA/DNA helicase IGHMBP2
MVRSNSRGEVGFLADRRRINVAITRARRHLCVICDSQTCKNDEFLKSFLDYCEKNADIRSGFDYENLSTEDGVSLDLGFEDIKFQKLKIAEPKKTEPKSDIKREKKAKIFEPVQVETEEDKKFQAQVVKIIENLNGEHAFPSDLNSRQRRIVHELAEKYKLYHMSKGTDDKRTITISKFAIKLPESISKAINETKPNTEAVKSVEIVETKLENVDLELSESKVFEVLQDELHPPESKSTKKNNNKTLKKEKSKIQAESKPAKVSDAQLLGEIADQNDSNLNFRSDCRQCKNCSKYILNVNFLMHELHCTKVSKESELKLKNNVLNEKGACGIAAKLDTKIKKNPIQTSNTDDFDELLNMFQDTNNVCNYKGCKTLVKTLGQNCEFCRHRFCLSHSLAEVINFNFNNS